MGIPMHMDPTLWGLGKGHKYTAINLPSKL
uniref:Uncharacterized protein n=1 Tax=Rhizophora mucronata TaxID=61149 RepID=A0A2P2QIS9_RHIMU